MTIQKTDCKGKTVNLATSLESSRRLLKGGEMPRDQTKAVTLKIEEGKQIWSVHSWSRVSTMHFMASCFPLAQGSGQGLHPYLIVLPLACCNLEKLTGFFTIVDDPGILKRTGQLLYSLALSEVSPWFDSDCVCPDGMPHLEATWCGHLLLIGYANLGDPVRKLSSFSAVEFLISFFLPKQPVGKMP